MKKQHFLIGFFALLLLFSFTWSQQEQQQQQKEQTKPQQEQQAPLLKDVEHLKDSKVHNKQGEEIGSIEHIVANLATGRVAFVIMNADANGGMLSGGRTIAVPYPAFKVSEDAKLVLDADEQKIKNAPEYTENGEEYFEKDKRAAQPQQQREMQAEKPWYENGERQLWHSRTWTEEMYRYWGLNFQEHQAEYFGWGENGRSEKIVRIDKMRTGTERTRTEQQQEQQREQEKKEQQRQTMTQPPMTQQTPLLKNVEDLKDMDVVNRQGEKIGSAENMVMNLATGRIAYVIMSADANGGAMAGGRTIAVPFPAFKVSQDAKLVLEADEQKIKSAPEYSENGEEYFDKDKRAMEQRRETQMEKPWYGENGERQLWHSRTWNEEMYRYWGLNFQEHQAEYFGWGKAGRSDRIIRLNGKDIRRTETQKDQPGWTQEQGTRTEQPQERQDPMRTTRQNGSMQTPLLKDIDALKGKDVINRQGEEIGSVDKVVANLATGRIAFVIMDADVNGGLFSGGRKIAVPYAAFSASQDARLVLDADEQKLKNAPEFKENGDEYFERDRTVTTTRDREMEQRERETQQRRQEMDRPWYEENGDRQLWHSRTWTEEMYRYWGLNFQEHQADYFGWGENGEKAKVVTIEPGRRTEQQRREQEKQQQQQYERREQMSRPDMSMQTPLIREIDDLKDKDVINRQGEEIGSVDQIVVNLATGRIAYVIMDADVNGGLFSGGRKIAVPYPAFHVSQDARLVLDADEQKLKSAPEYSENGEEYFERDRAMTTTREREMERPWYEENGDRQLWHSRTWNQEMYSYWGLNFQEHQSEFFGWGENGQREKVIRIEKRTETREKR